MVVQMAVHSDGLGEITRRTFLEMPVAAYVQAKFTDFWKNEFDVTEPYID